MTCTGPPTKINGFGQFEDEVPAQPAIPVDFPVVTPDDDGLSFTRSAYGLGIPIVFGSDLLDCNVFWHNGFERKTFLNVEGELSFYSTTSFAVGICEGVVNAVLRLWVGDKLVLNNLATVDNDGVVQPGPGGVISGATVDLTDEDSPLRRLGATERQTKLTIFNGSSTQVPTGVMVDVEGYTFSPGYRGVSYILFENLLVTDAVPDIRIEVCSNALNLFPRLYGELPAGQLDVLATGDRAFLGYDPSYDVFYVGAQDLSISPTQAGVVIFDGNNFDVFANSVLEGGDNSDLAETQGRYCHILTNGQLLTSQSNVGFGEWNTYNPFAAVAIDQLEGGNVLGDHTFEGLGGSVGGGITFVTNSPQTGLPVDVLCTPTRPGRRGIGFAEIDATGQITYRAYTNGFFTGTGKVRLVYYPVLSSISDTQPLFPDGGSTVGQHIYVLSHFLNETNSIKVERVSVSAPYSIADPLYATVGEISLEEIDQLGFVYELHHAFVCHADSTFILLLKSSTRPHYALKWDPKTATVIWKTALVGKFGVESPQDEQPELIYGNKYAFIDDNGNGAIYSIDLSTGDVTTPIPDMVAQDLPPPINDMAYYNGREDTITYVSNTAGKQLVKVFLGRANRQQAPISSIVTTLLERVGWSQYDTIVDDLQVLSLNGYTIRQPTQLRTVFSELKQIFRFDVVESNGKILYKTRGSLPTQTIREVDLGAGSGLDGGWLREVHEYDFANTRKINLTYRDLGRDYKDNVQSMILPKYTNTRVDSDAAIDVTAPIVLEADEARKLAEILLYSKIIYETGYEGSLPPSQLTLDPGDVVTLEFEDATEDVIIRIRDVNIGQDLSVEFTASREDPDIYRDQVNLFGNVGRFNEAVFPPVPRRIDPLLLRMPFRTAAEAADNDTRFDFYPVYLTLLNSRVTSLPNGLVTVTVGGATTTEVPAFTNYPTWGYVTTPLVNTASFFSTDYESTLRVKMMSQSGANLGSAADLLALLNSRTTNFAYVGEELIQFVDCVDEGDGNFLFTTINRCQYGTETRAANHERGEYFVLLGGDDGVLDTGSVRVVSTPLGTTPAKAVLTKIQTGSPYQPTPLETYQSLQFRPRTPTSPVGYYDGDDIELEWQRRARYGADWPDDGPEPVPFYDGVLPQFTVYLTKTPNDFSPGDSSSYLRTFTQEANSFTYTLSMQTEDSFVNSVDTLWVLVNHSGSFTGQDPGPSLLYQVGPKGL